MSITNGESVVTKEILNEYHQAILPYLGGSGIPRMVANKFSKGDLYSTDERMIGQWIDGKPLYQKTIVKSNFIINQGASFVHGINNVDHIFMKEGHLDDNGNVSVIPLLWTDSYNGVYVTSTNIVFKGTGTWGAETTRIIYITLCYTKTTDSPISIGSDTDYSTEEKIVGTWIDGKPLYQKTVTYTNPSAIGQNTINMLTLEEDATKDYIDSEIIFIANWGTAPYNHFKLPYYQYADDATLYVDMKPQLKTGIAQVRLITYAYSYSANDIIFLATLRYTKTTD